MELEQIIPHIEALIFASDKPLSSSELVDLINNALGFIDDKATLEEIDAAINSLQEKYNSDLYAFEMKETGGGWQFLTKKEYHKTIAAGNFQNKNILNFTGCFIIFIKFCASDMIR